MNNLLNNSKKHRKSGQTLIFLAMVVIMIAFAALFYFDVNKTLHIKGLSRNGADAAALSAARWQAVSLNLIGSLNVAAAVAVTEDLSDGTPETPTADIIADLQRRISFSGPLLGYVSAQQAAKQNGIFNNPEFSRITRQDMDDFESLLQFDPPRFIPSDSYSTSTEELMAMIQLLPEEGMAVRTPAQYPNLPSGELLLNPDFYDAIAGSDWCWFFFNARTTLENYNHWQFWSLTPEDIDAIYAGLPIRTNSPYFTLWLNWVTVRDHLPFPSLPEDSTWEQTINELRAALINFAIDDMQQHGQLEEYFEIDAQWAFYNSGMWSSWSGYTGGDAFPWDSEREIKEEYDHSGADAAVEVDTENRRHTRIFDHGTTSVDDEGEKMTAHRIDTVHTTAAAKPFGSLEGEDGDVPANFYDLVLPAFTDVRLIPLGTSRSGSRNQLRRGWIAFVRDILPGYLEQGPVYFEINNINNYYANQLIRWENTGFRNSGISWLLNNSGRCPPPDFGGGGSGPSGGTSFGH